MLQMNELKLMRTEEKQQRRHERAVATEVVRKLRELGQLQGVETGIAQRAGLSAGQAVAPKYAQQGVCVRTQRFAWTGTIAIGPKARGVARRIRTVELCAVQHLDLIAQVEILNVGPPNLA